MTITALPVTGLWDPQADPLTRENWWQFGVCDEVDPETFYPADGDGPETIVAKNTNAKRVCQGCPARAFCLQDAIETGDWEYGVRGGMSASARRKYARETLGDEAMDAIVKRKIQDHYAMTALAARLAKPRDPSADRDRQQKRAARVRAQVEARAGQAVQDAAPGLAVGRARVQLAQAYNDLMVAVRQVAAIEAGGGEVAPDLRARVDRRKAQVERKREELADARAEAAAQSEETAA
jgi:hypothetical protein